MVRVWKRKLLILFTLLCLVLPMSVLAAFEENDEQSQSEEVQIERANSLSFIEFSQNSGKCGTSFVLPASGTEASFSRANFDALEYLSKVDCLSFIILFDVDDDFPEVKSLVNEVTRNGQDDWDAFYLENRQADLNKNLQITGGELHSLQLQKQKECLVDAIKKPGSENDGNQLSNTEPGSRYEVYFDNYLTGTGVQSDAVIKTANVCLAEELGDKVLAITAENIADIPFTSEFYDVRELLTSPEIIRSTTEEGGPVIAFILKIVNFLIRVSGIASLFMLVVGAYMLLTAAGGEEQIGKGKETITYAFVGMAIVVFAFMIVSFVQAIIF